MTKTPNYVIKHQVLRVADKVMDINLNSNIAAWFEIIGHCDMFQVTVAKSKEKYQEKIYEKRWVAYSGGLLKEDFGEIIDGILKELNEVENQVKEEEAEEKRKKDIETLKRLQAEYPNV